MHQIGKAALAVSRQIDDQYRTGQARIQPQRRDIDAVILKNLAQETPGVIVAKAADKTARSAQPGNADPHVRRSASGTFQVAVLFFRYQSTEASPIAQTLFMAFIYASLCLFLRKGELNITIIFVINQILFHNQPNRKMEQCRNERHHQRNTGERTRALFNVGLIAKVAQQKSQYAPAIPIPNFWKKRMPPNARPDTRSPVFFSP